MKKRHFLKNLSALSLGVPLSFSHIEELVQRFSHLSPEELSSDEKFWAEIRSGYRLKPDYINLENGYYCFMPQETLDHFIEHIKEINYQGSYYMRTVQYDNQNAIAAELAEMAGCSAEELIITRNTTESMDMIISGLDWKPGDEAVMAEQDYGAMLNQFKLIEKRYGTLNKVVSIPNHPASDDDIVKLYASAITPKTKLLMVCHMINVTGQILPIRKICDMAHEKGVEVMVDGAHAFAHFDFKIDELNCDYYGTSLHKWLSVPLGAGLLYVKKEKIPKVWPLFAEGPRDPYDISRLNHKGTHPVHTHLAIRNAITYHNVIGIKRKESRLKFLQDYWARQLEGHEGIIINTPKEMSRHGAIGNVGVKGMKPSKLSKQLFEKYRIWTVAIDMPSVKGVRVTPNVYTTTGELDQFVAAIQEIAA